jgi:signal transduction histidine kinase
VRQTDKHLNSEYLVLLGSLEDGGNVYMRVALESIRESAQITNRFFILVSAAAIVISILVIVVLSRSISHPIRALSEISRRMTCLDFDAKYVSGRHASREIDELGLAMNEMSRTLEQTISELKTANVSLQQDIEKKEQIDEMRKEFLSNVSHELKTPLALIGGYAEGLKECINDDESSRDFYCDVIMDETEKMNHMVKQLLELNQLEFGNDRIEMTRFDIAQLAAGVIQTASLMASQKQVEIHLESDAPVYVWGDEFKVEQVITNYLTNAINHAEGERQVTIRFAHCGNLVRTSVFNTGQPIPEEEQDKIWIKFYKVDKARTREYGGSGIGLSIVKAIMDSHHQACGVSNHEDGVEFWMELESNN